MLLPAWTNWQTHGHDITFRDEGGHATIFTYDPMGYWMGEVPREGLPPLVIRLKRS